MIVVDASVVVKWFLDEPLSAAALRLREVETDIRAPDLLVVEVMGALVRVGNMRIAPRATIDAAIDVFRVLCTSGDILLDPVDLDLTRDAASLALDLGHPIKDCLYLILAARYDCRLVTADAQFAAKAGERVHLLT